MRGSHGLGTLGLAVPWWCPVRARGGAAEVRALLKQAQRLAVKGSLAKAAERFLRRQVEIEDLTPLHTPPAARAEHAARMSEAQVA